MSEGRLSAIGYPLSERAAGGELRVGTLMDELSAALTAAAVSEARAEARDIVAVALGQPRLWPSAHEEDLVPEAARGWARAAARRRAAGAPFAYAVGRSDFRSLTLRVDERVLIPRQETEELVELVLAETGGGDGMTLADVGTGSGAIALALAHEGRFGRVIATDLSSDALAVARENVAAIRADARERVSFRVGSLLAPLRGLELDVIVANPPYVAIPEARELSAGVRDWEPALALFGGLDGLDCYREITRTAAPLLRPRGLLALEVDVRRAALVAEMLIVDSRYTDVRVHRDLSGRDRFVTARAGAARAAAHR